MSYSTNNKDHSIAASPFLLPKTSLLKLFTPLVERFTGLSALHKHYLKRPTSSDTKTFLRHTLNTLGIEHSVFNLSDANIPKDGPLIIVANHPLGGVEGVILANILLDFRPDLLVMANHFLKRIPELSSLFIGVNVFEGKDAIRENMNAIKQTNQHLANNGALLIFPAGEVSTYDKKSGLLQDKQWNRLVGKLVQNHQASCLPVFIGGANSKTFYFAGRIHPLLRTLLLGRELLNKKGKNISVTGGSLIASNELKKLNNAYEITNYLRLNTYLIPQKAQDHSAPLGIETSQVKQEDIWPDISAIDLYQAIQDLPDSALLVKQKQFSTYISNAKEMGVILTQIGIIRERNFRAVGEGTGKRIDLDEFDQSYLHLFIWDEDKKAIVGAYRLGLVDDLIQEGGIDRLYSRTLFNFNEAFIKRQTKAIEMGRSVIDQPYQRSLTPLLLLWKGIATYVYRNPEYQTLFGPVSITGEYQALTHQLIIQCLTTHYYDQQSAKLVKAINPVESKKTFWSLSMLTGLADLQLLSNLVSRLENGRSLPVLIRQYLSLNGRFVCFNVDPDFNQAVDGLIIVNLPLVEKHTLGKYMGQEEAEIYIKQHSASLNSNITSSEEYNER
ncbi:lysophospholipid acyltransferase family protein [Marinomonas agarivorans]|nr:lysophospholipid acyltransferase family protein [Marinomonas agarivorans]